MAAANSENDTALTPAERRSVLITVGLSLAFIATAWISYAQQVPFVLALSLGCIGGLFHELFQSGGKMLFFTKKEDGLYLGALTGMLLGGVSGSLAARGVSADAAQLQALAYEAFLAGVGLKGLTEAAAGTAVSVANVGQPEIAKSLPEAPTRVQPPAF